MVSLSKLRSWCENSKCPSQGLQRIEPHPWLSGSESTRPCCNLSDAYPYWEWSLKLPCRSTATLAAKNRQDGVHDKPRLSKTDKLR